jgi:hypothetical protein
MPNWSTKPTAGALNDAIGQALQDLDLADNPAFDEVIGMSFDEITKHAMQALTVLITANDLDPDDPSTLVQIYVLGFVVGTKYGERRATPE